jgi:predicted metal-dependent enzyme (double-stranded beta helix superfamily)
MKPYKRKVLYRDKKIEIVLCTWPPGSESKFHDHGKSVGKILVLKGFVFNRAYSKSRKMWLPVVVHTENDTIVETPDIIHTMGNCSDKEAQTLHWYSPPLKMKIYKEKDLK